MTDSSVPGVPHQGKSVESFASASRGRLVFQDDMSIPFRLSHLPPLRELLAFRVFLASGALVLYGLLMVTLYYKTIDPMKALILLSGIVMLLIMDLQVIARFEHSARPLKIYESGIEMPMTWFEKFLLRRRFVSWEDISTIYTVKHNAMEEGEIVRGVETEIVLVTKDGIAHSTFIKDRTEIKKAIDVISSLWARFDEEKARIEDLERRGTGFSRTFAAIQPASILIPSVILDILLLTALGISVLSDADMIITVIIIVFAVILFLVFGYIMMRIGRARTELFAPPSIISHESSQ